MREIKFRAWQKEEKRMCGIASFRWAEWRGDYYNDHLSINLINKKHKSGKGYCLEWVTPNEVILMQSTGFTDRDGVDIYEGDIVSNEYGPVWEVVYSLKRAGRFSLAYYMTNPNRGNLSFRELRKNTTIKVVGNIYENPELLEPLGDCNGCGSDHDPHECPKL